MKVLYALILFLFTACTASFAQEDTIPTPRRDTIKVDSAPPRRDSIPVRTTPRPIDTTRRVIPVVPTTTQVPIDSPTSQINQPVSSNEISWKPIPDSVKFELEKGDILDNFRRFIYRTNFFIGFATDITRGESDLRVFHGKEPIFYYIIFLLLLFGSLRLLFEKYFFDLFRVFFRTTLKQRQISEQLLQSPLPSVFMNGFFVLSAGLYINFLLRYFDFSLHENFWMQYLYCIAGLTTIYLGKFVGLKLTGWVFNVSDATDAYIFIVFLINKTLGMFLLPFLVLLAFSGGTVLQISLVLSWIGIGILLIYRIILSYAAVRNKIELNPFHFILYLMAFEVIPLLLIYKLLLMIF